MKKNILLLAVFLFVCSLVIISCKKDKEGTTTLNVRLTDVPTAFDEVNVDIREVLVKFEKDTTSNGWVTLATNPGIYNLLSYQNGIDTLLATGTFPVQVVKEIRFILGPNNTIKNNGTIFPLTIPSGSESGLKIKFSKKLDQTLNILLIDFDAAMSVSQNGSGSYILKPVIRIK